MTPPPPTPESELVARLRDRPDRVKHGALGYYSPNDAALDTEAAATIERLHSAHEAGRREGIEMAAKVCDGLLEANPQNNDGGMADIRWGKRAAWSAAARDIRALYVGRTE